MNLPQTAEAVIIGGGVMGVSTAYHLALKGCQDVLLLERESFLGMEATGKCAGGIRYQFGTEINVRLSQLSLPMLDRFEEELGQPIDLRYCGYLFLLTNEEDAAVFRQNVEMQRRLGVETQWLGPDEIARMVPLLNMDGILAGTIHPGDGLADPNGVVQGYASGARRQGAKLLTGVQVTGIRVESGRVRGVITDQGEVATPVVVNAAGPWAGEVGKMAGVDIPIVPVRRQIVVTGPMPEIPPDFPFVIEFAKSLYFHREGPGILTGMSNPDEIVSFDQSLDQNWELVHMEAAMKRLPILEKAGLASHWAGLYENSPDAHPILGRIPEVEGFYCVGGFSGHGFQHGPACGLLLAEEILDGKAHTLDISQLDLARFSEGREIVEYNVV
ncbi:MAG: FAD-binding oxidoreductase [Chloroflexi bacterium]|nr:MAG: FAD dependent oxidoreductase [Anaerolineaceae bacterium 4572_32.2]RLC82308.1 MAG: FAD-binding oxidoreductase [Chloroflexota bacterium]RLC86439.1 MAG: FAD-binding oxidoreductase [Chloroflexota bacterium]HEY72454.1 FAD-binding oxidoreductase [Thermoflexia bacterium]